MIPYRFMIVIAFLLVTVFCFHIITYRYLQTSSYELMQSTNELRYSIEHEQWTLSHNTAKQFLETWKKTMPRWSLFLDHPELDHIHMSISKLYSYIKTNSKEDALAELETVQRMIEHLPQKEQLTLKNIL